MTPILQRGYPVDGKTIKSKIMAILDSTDQALRDSYEDISLSEHFPMSDENPVRISQHIRIANILKRKLLKTISDIEALKGAKK